MCTLWKFFIHITLELEDMLGASSVRWSVVNFQCHEPCAALCAASAELMDRYRRTSQ
jgi:hypothetical protein